MPLPPEVEPLDFLLGQICHLHYTRMHELLEAINLYRGQPPLLRALWEQEGMTHTQLAERMRVTPATITKMIQRMERAGFITRQADPDDQRVSRVYLTETGRAIQDEMLAIWRTMEAETFAGLSDQELADLRASFIKMRKNLIHVNQGPIEKGVKP